MWRTSFRNKKWKLLFIDRVYLYKFWFTSVEGYGSNPWVAGSNLVPVLLFISFVEFYEYIFGAIVIDFETF